MNRRRLDGHVSHPENCPGAFPLEAHVCHTQLGVKFSPRGGVLQDRQGLFLRDTLGGFFPREVLKGAGLGVGLYDFFPMHRGHAAVFQDSVAGVFLRLPTLCLLDDSHGFVSSAYVKTVIGPKHFQVLGVNAVDGNMNVVIVRVVMQGIGALALLKTHFPQEDVHQFFDLLRAGVFLLTP